MNWRPAVLAVTLALVAGATALAGLLWMIDLGRTIAAVLSIFGGGAT